MIYHNTTIVAEIIGVFDILCLDHGVGACVVVEEIIIANKCYFRLANERLHGPSKASSILIIILPTLV